MYLSEIVHGPFDADKLDYMHRDGAFSGLRMNVDLDRLLHSMHVFDEPGGKRVRLAGSVAGTTPLEQIMFNKMILHTGIYHHHKVRACDCMLWAVFELALKRKSKIGGILLSKETDFLRLTDDALLIQSLCDDDNINTILGALRDRRIWKRALVLARSTVDPECSDTAAKEKPSRHVGSWQELLNLQGNDRERFMRRRELSKKIWKEAKKPCGEHEVWLDVPRLPTMEEAKRTWIDIPGSAAPTELKDIVPIDYWIQQYGTHKWRSHVFCPEEAVPAINRAAVKVLDKELNLKVLPTATQFAKIPVPPTV
jgi:HD superfamily phosphohydrolase